MAQPFYALFTRANGILTGESLKNPHSLRVLVSSPPANSRGSARKIGPGSVLDGRFSITGQIGDGMFATVFKAEDLQDGNRVVAVKIPHDNIEIDDDLFARFQAEEDMGAGLDHPNILKFVRVKYKSRPYFVMEFLEGETLYAMLKTRRILPEAEALSIASRLCDALGHLHAHDVIHRDLKPENVMVCPDGSLRLMDFGIALYPNCTRVTFMGFAPGTPHYMAPERVRGKKGDGRTDLYSLGAMLYQMLTGVIAFDHQDISVIMETRSTGDPPPPRQINPEISEAAEEIVLHSMERNPDNRFATAEAMKAELDHPETTPLTGRWRRMEPSTPWRRARRHVRKFVLWGLIPLALQVLGFFLLWHHFKKK